MKSFVPKRAVIRFSIRILIFLMLPVYSFSQSNLCSAPTPINSAGAGCTNVTGQTLTGATASAPAIPGSCSTAGGDVWYSFTAQSTNPTITISSLGANFRSNGYGLQVLSGTCPSGFTNLGCNSRTGGGAGTTLSVSPTLTINQTYFIRVYTGSASPSGTYGYNICINNPVPANDDCTGAVLLTSATTCGVPVEGNLGPASNSTVTITAPSCVVGTAFDDVWYRFVAQTTNPTITMSGLNNFANPGMQLLDNNCGGTFTSLFCGTTSIAADFLVPGAIYYIRIYSTTNITGSAEFDICITDPVATVPPNDECTGAINLLISASCSNIPGTLAGATYNGTIPLGCAPSTPAYDVWYKFTATTASSTITLSGAGANIITPRIQLFSGSCGVLTSLACGTTTITNATVTGTTYYVRVYSTTGPAPNGNADFNICVAATGALVRYGNSYVNVTRKTTGGVVQPGDVLEIRMTINHTSGTMTKLRFVDNIPSKTVMDVTTPLRDSIKVITNEGLTFRKYTLKGGDDAGTYLASPPVGEYNIRLNLGFGATGANPTAPGIPTNNSTAVAGAVGQMVAASDRPKGGGGMLFAVAYRVLVTGVVGDTIVLNPSQFIYNNGVSDITLTGTSYKLVISNPLTLCTNSIGVNIASEFGGTFGSGTSTNRSTDLTIPISGYSFISNVNANNAVGDGRYGIVKNVSPKNSTVTAAQRQPTCAAAPTMNINDPLNCNNRMFGHWYIAGDHTGTNNAAGNPPPAPGTAGGYMLLVNADYVASEIYKQDLTNLCPNTYYEFSAWIKNVCATCGADSIGAQFTGTPTAPTAGYVGVYPNLSFALNGVDYYSTGEVDTTGWQKRGFVFKTDTAQTTATFSIRNNSQGAGGNDWALDDIAVATCFPGMTYSPSSNPNICSGNFLYISDTVRSFFDNYVNYKWQRWAAATSGPWLDIPGATGSATPTLVGGLYQYINTYTIPPMNTLAANNGDKYRLVVASKASNLASATCSYSDPTTITLNVLPPCGPPLKADLLSASGRLTDNISKISWITADEDEQVTFSVEKSLDGANFTSIGTVNGYFNISAPKNYYSFTDPVLISNKTYYRVVMTNSLNTKKYSSIIVLNPGGSNKFDFGSVTNPFASTLQYEINSGVAGNARIELIDGYGKVVKSENQQIYVGSNSLNMYTANNLPDGVYVVRATMNGNTIYHKVIKGK